MRRFPLGDSRLVDLPEKAELCDRVTVLAGDKECAALFIRDDGTNARTIALIAVPMNQVGAFAKSAVLAAELLGIDWKSVQLDIRPPQDGRAH